MQIICPSCQQAIDFSGPRPAFCGYCGKPLAASGGSSDDTLVHSSQGGEKAATNDPILATRLVGPYRLRRQLGQGGMGVVWEAEHVENGRRVALKLLSPGSARTKESVERFLQEGRLAASLSHPRSTFVYGAGEHKGQPFIAMELMPGRTLRDLVEDRGPLPVEQAVDYLLDVIDGLHAAHELGVIHRDVKPSNCFLDGQGRSKVGDFGLSKSLVSDAALTRTGAFMGTPQFAAPEQVRSEGVDRRTDVYAAGATLYYLLAGDGPFTGDAAAVIAKIVSDPPPSLRNKRPEVPKALDRIVARCLEKNPDSRFADLAQLRAALFPYATGGTSIADIGRRLAAYTLDGTVLSLIVGLLSMLFGVALGMSAAATGTGSVPLAAPEFQLAQQVVLNFLQMLYFAICEGSYGRGLGKWVMGLRVTTLSGERAGFLRALSRSWFIPGNLGLFLLPSIVEFARPLPLAQANGSMGILRTIALSSVGILVPIVCLLFMRKRNGYRGLHELASGTRVVRQREQRSALKPLVLPQGLAGPVGSLPERLGSFKVLGDLGAYGDSRLLLGQDESLQRIAWLVLGPEAGLQISPARKTVVRTARLHWLQGGEADGRRWEAFEAAPGALLADAAAASGGLEWEQGLQLLTELVEELQAAVSDGTLPDRLSLNQVWIDRGGRLKLLDAPLGVQGGGSTGANDGDDPAGSAVRLLRQSLELCAADPFLPSHVRQFRTDLVAKPNSQTTLAWFAEQLRGMRGRGGGLRWDDRLGVLGVSMGTEMTLYLGAAFVPPFLYGLSGMYPSPVVCVLFVAASLLLPLILGCWPKGGPVFWFMGGDVRRRDGSPASRLRCGVRNVLAWATLIVPYALLGLITAKIVAVNGGMPVDGQPIKMTGDQAEQLGPLLLGGVCLAPFFFLGAVYCIVRPHRGLQDLLAGTMIVRK